MTEQQASAPHRVVIAGGGVAGLEALIALPRLAGDRVAITLLAPRPSSSSARSASRIRSRGRRPRRYALQRIAADHGAEFVQDGLAAVDPDQERVTTTERDPPAVRLAARRGRRPPRAGVRAGDDLPGAAGRRGDARADPGRRGRLRQVDRVRGAARRDLAAAAVRAGAHDRRARVQRQHGRRADLGHARRTSRSACSAARRAESVADALADAGISRHPGRARPRGRRTARSSPTLARSSPAPSAIVALPRLEGPRRRRPGGRRARVPARRRGRARDRDRRASSPPATARRPPSSRAASPPSRRTPSPAPSRAAPAPTSRRARSAPCSAPSS